MQHSSETIGAIAAALAKAQGELANPEKSLTATIQSPFPREDARTFRYAPLSSGLEIVRKCLGKHEIAAVQTTAIDADTGLIRLTTMLAHSSGEWVSSDWPVCPVSETAAPHRMGAALTYARRYALFTLVGIAGEDDADAPDLVPSAPGQAATPAQTKSKPAALAKPHLPGTSLLPPEDSAQARDKFLRELESLSAETELTDWAQRTLSRKGSLIPADAKYLEEAFAAKAATLAASSERSANDPTIDEAKAPNPALDVSVTAQHDSAGTVTDTATLPTAAPSSSKRKRAGRIDKSALAFPEPRRIRDKDHLKFVAQQPCLVCGRQPCDAHHLRFAQPRALGRKVSDEFTVPLCRTHHRALHDVGDEERWWSDQHLDPLSVATRLWRTNRPLPEPKQSTMTKGSESADNNEGERLGPMAQAR